MTDPLVSVLLPVRRWQRHTRAAVDSLLEQTLSDIEILVIGHDDVAELAHRLPPDPRLRYLPRLQPGVVGATNTGLGEARGIWVARMDDDDVALPNRLETQLGYLVANPSIGLCGARVSLIDENGRRDGVGQGNRRYETWLDSLVDPDTIAEACFIENPLPNPTVFAHRDLWHQLGGYREGDFPEDHDLVLRAWLAGIRMGKPSEVLLHWREHAERITWSDPRYRREAFIKLKASVACNASSGFEIGAGSRPVWICGVGRNARYWHDALVQNGARIECFVDLDRANARQSKRHRPVITYQTLWSRLASRSQAQADLGDDDSQHEAPFIVSAISEPAARDTLRTELEAHGLICHVDFLMGG